MTITYGRIPLDGIQPSLTSGPEFVSGTKLYVYLTGTDTLATVYNNAQGNSPVANPIVSDTLGSFYDQSNTYWVDATMAYDLNVVYPFGASTFYSNVYAIGPAPNTSAFLQNPSPALTGAPTAPTPTIGSNNSQIATMAALSQALGAQTIFPSGMVALFAMSAIPTGWFGCNGQAVSRTTYSNLFAAIGTTFGTGDGSTTFNVPNLGGQFVRGWASGQSIDSGRAFGSSQSDEMQGHVHGPPAGQTQFLTYVTGATAANATTGGGNFAFSSQTSTPQSDGTNGTPRTGTETRPVNIALIYGIKA